MIVEALAKSKVTLIICAGALRTIWKTTNDMAINKKVLTSPKVVIYKTLILIKFWRPMLKLKLESTAEERCSTCWRLMLSSPFLVTLNCTLFKMLFCFNPLWVFLVESCLVGYSSLVS
jgi:hypothetical protein